MEIDSAQFSPPERALRWFYDNQLPSGGIRIHSHHNEAYPEVTGYIIPTLFHYGHRDLAIRLCQWLKSVQRPDGSFALFDDDPSYSFDTGQILRGYLANWYAGIQGFEYVTRRTAYYLFRQLRMTSTGAFPVRYDQLPPNDILIPESIHLYALPPLLWIAGILDLPEYREAVNRCISFYLRQPYTLQTATLTHFLAYEIEALIDLGRVHTVLPVLEKLRERQTPDGAVPAMDGVSWVCTPGLAQLAICWYKVGDTEPAEKAMKWLEAHQLPSGGFYGSYGEKSVYFAYDEISWATKYYLDAHRLRVSARMNDYSDSEDVLPEAIDTADGRVQAVFEQIQEGDMVVEVGCGKGRFLKALQQLQPYAMYFGVDIATELLDKISTPIYAFEGSLERVPFDDNTFNVAFSVEAIEHSANLEAAVSELIRITRRGGSIIIIDKHFAQWGRLECPPWERWPDKDWLRQLLQTGCDQVTAIPISYDSLPASDGLMYCWHGRKRW